MLVVLATRFAERDPDRNDCRVGMVGQLDVLRPGIMAQLPEKIAAAVLDPVMNMTGWWHRISTAVLAPWLWWQE